MPGGGVDSEPVTAPSHLMLGLVPLAVAVGAFVLVEAADWEWYTAWLILVGLGALAAAAGVLMPALRAFQTLMDCVTEGLGWVAKWLVPVLVVLAFTKVLFRYIGRWQNERIVDIALLDQWQLHVFGYIFLLSLPYVLKNGINVRVDFLFQNYPARARAAIDFAGHVIGLIPFCLLAIWTTWDKTSTSLWRNARPRGSRPWQFWRVWEPYEGTPGGLPPGPVLLTMTACFVLLLLQTFAELVKLFDVLAGKREGASELVAIEEPPLRVE
jgi:TRAP-type mannitol/chloroaromatic compound transport system permease small subunit